MSEESINDAHFSEIDDIHVAADLLRRMLLELEDLEVGNSRLHFAISNKRYAIRQRLDMLTGVAALLKESAAPPLGTLELRQRAKKLIGQLHVELEDLALRADHEFDWVT
jgi:hypothetical protein